MASQVLGRQPPGEVSAKGRLSQAKKLLTLAHKGAGGRSSTILDLPGSPAASGSPVAAASPADHLRSLGYQVEGGWVQKDGPSLSLAVSEHEEVNGHTIYKVECLLLLGDGEPVKWQVGKRLRHLRERLHDPVKAHLGVDKYARLFENCRFPARGGGRGTTKALNAWSQRLAAAANGGNLVPVALSLVLRFFEAPSAPVPTVAPPPPVHSGGSPSAVARSFSGADCYFSMTASPAGNVQSSPSAGDAESSAVAGVGVQAPAAATQAAASVAEAGTAAAVASPAAVDPAKVVDVPADVAATVAAPIGAGGSEAAPGSNRSCGAGATDSTACDTPGRSDGFADSRASAAAARGAVPPLPLAGVHGEDMGGLDEAYEVESDEGGTIYDSDDSFGGEGEDICGRMHDMIQQLEHDLQTAALEGADKEELTQTLTQMRDWAADFTATNEDEESSEHDSNGEKLQ